MKKKIICFLSILFVICLGLSLFASYWIMSNSHFNFLGFFIKFSIIVLPISLVWLGLLLSKGNWREINNHIRSLVVFAAVFMVASFCVLKWTNTVNNYGMYAHYIQNAEYTGGSARIYAEDQNTTVFEKETIYREYMNSRYDLEFTKMWMFGAFVFLSSFLLLQVIPKRKE